MSEFTPLGDAMKSAAKGLKVVKDRAPERHSDLDIHRLMLHAGVPIRYADARFDNWRDTTGTRTALRAARRVAEKPGNLILVGPWGCGKTRLSASLMAARIDAYLTAFPHEVISEGDEGIATRPPFASRFAGVPELLDAIRRSYEYPEQPDPLLQLRRAPLLILDDMGREKATDWVLERLYVLLDDRYGHRLPTVVTTNYSLDELARRDYGAMVSRLTEDGTVVKISAADQRPVTA